MSRHRDFWKQMVDEYTEVNKEIRAFGVRISEGNLLTTEEGARYRELRETRDRLIRSMGAEFPNLFAYYNLATESNHDAR